MSEPAYGSRPSSTVEPSALLHEPPHPGPARPGSGHAAPTTVVPEHGPATAYLPASSGTSSGTSSGSFPGAHLATERNWATAAHLSGFVAAFFFLGFLGPLVVLVTEGRRSPFVRRHAVEALNFNLSILLWLTVSAVLILALVGLLLVPAVGILYLVSTVLGAMAASRGDEFRYPLTIRFVS